MADIPHYLAVIADTVTSEYPDAEIKAPCPVFGRPGAIGVIVIFPIEEGGEVIESETDQKIGFVVSTDDLDNDDKLKELATLAISCRRNLVRSDFIVRGAGRLSLKGKLQKAMRGQPLVSGAASS